jgi:hypothetical protein
VTVKAVPAVVLELAGATEKCVAAGGGCEVAPQPTSRHDPQSDRKSNKKFFMTPSQAFEGFLLICAYLLLRESERKSIISHSVLFCAGAMGNRGTVEKAVYNPSTTEVP